MPEYFIENEMINFLNTIIRQKTVTKRTIESLISRIKNPLKYKKILGKRIFIKSDIDTWLEKELRMSDAKKPIRVQENNDTNKMNSTIFREGLFNE